MKLESLRSIPPRLKGRFLVLSGSKLWNLQVCLSVKTLDWGRKYSALQQRALSHVTNWCLVRNQRRKNAARSVSRFFTPTSVITSHFSHWGFSPVIKTKQKRSVKSKNSLDALHVNRKSTILWSLSPAWLSRLQICGCHQTASLRPYGLHCAPSGTPSRPDGPPPDHRPWLHTEIKHLLWSWMTLRHLGVRLSSFMLPSFAWQMTLL